MALRECSASSLLFAGGVESAHNLSQRGCMLYVQDKDMQRTSKAASCECVRLIDITCYKGTSAP